MAGLMNVFFLSLRRDAAIKLAIADLTIHLAPFDPEYKGRVAFHSCGCKDESDRAEACKNLIAFGFPENEVPEDSILGWGKLESVKEYDKRSFDTDSAYHGYKNLDLFKAQEKWEKVFGWVLKEQRYLPLPVMGIQGKTHGDWWTASDPFQTLCLKRALEGESLDVTKI